MGIDSVEMSLIPACSWRQAEYSPIHRSGIGYVVVELSSGVVLELCVLSSKGKVRSRVASNAKCRETTTMKCASVLGITRF